MGLLSDPSLAPRNKIGRSLAKHSGKISVLFYAAGLVWFVCLAHTEFNHGTYLSENALSPGLLYTEVKQYSSRLAETLVDEMNRERIKHKSTTPYAWILAKMKQIGLETHVHNFTLRYPFTGGKEYHGKNVYGILRAPRIGSTEGIVFSAPYRAPTSIHADISASVPVLLAFADFARKKNYWAKDLVFLVTEQEQLGMHAWLEAYYGGDHCDPLVLSCGSLPGRAGALQAALNLEIQSLDMDYIDVKVEGLNGQLPNLDMFNLVQRITSREGISSGYKQTPRKKRRITHNTIEENLKRMVEMLASQITGVPNGNHGLFHRYRVESVTLEAVKRVTNSNINTRYPAGLQLLKIIEGISRSLNNLLERFHQSYFFYILVQNERFVSIGDFMPCLILSASPMFIKAFLLWLTIDKSKKDDDNSDSDESTCIHKDLSINSEPIVQLQLPYSNVLLYIAAAFGLGILCNQVTMQQNIREWFVSMGFSTASTVCILLGVVVVVGYLLPFVFTLPEGGLELLQIGTLVFLGTALILVGLLNFALGFFVTILYVPLAVIINPSYLPKSSQKTFTTLLAFLLNPFVVIYLIVLYLTFSQFSELVLKEICWRAIIATMDAITFALMDCIIYGNWLYNTITTIFFPMWILCWTLALSRRIKTEEEKEKIH